jgi:hypothetical protein
MPETAKLLVAGYAAVEHGSRHNPHSSLKALLIATHSTSVTLPPTHRADRLAD